MAAGGATIILTNTPGEAAVTGKGKKPSSLDPNDKIGPAGFGAQGFVSDQGVFSYRIDFENQPTATAAAQQVVVTDQLDANLDWSTFQFQTIAFNNVTISVPPNQQSYKTQVNVASDPNPVQVAASLNPSSGLVTVTMTSIDPATGQPVTDPLAGFLPPDDANGDGEGYVSYSVNPKPGLATGTAIKNQASIVFDANSPILTDQTLNTIDANVPTAQMNPLPATVLPTFTVSWSGSAGTGGSGIASYNVYASANGGAYSPWLSSTTQTSASYTGTVGTTYSFFVVATSNVGTVQQVSPQTAPVSTLVQAPSSNAALSSLVLSTGKISPVFAAGTLSYTVHVPAVTASLTVTPTVADSTATVTVNGTTVASGAASGPISLSKLSFGVNTIGIVVTAQDGVTTETYSVKVLRSEISSDLTGDGIDDLLFQHEAGYVAAWTMDGTGVPTGNISIYSGTGLAPWRLAAVADVNGDGIPDLIFQSTAGQIAAWTMNGTSGTPTGNITIYSGAGLAVWLLHL